MPDTTLPLVGNCGGEGGTRGVVGSPLQESRTASEATCIALIVTARLVDAVT